jgi:hypothetical protein
VAEQKLRKLPQEMLKSLRRKEVEAPEWTSLTFTSTLMPPPFFENGLPSKMSGLASPMAVARI